MTNPRPPRPELAPAWLPRQQRRRVDRELRKLMHGDVCSICGSRLKHNSRTTSGFDEQGNVVLAGECCVDRVTVTFGHGLYTDRQYDFLSSRKSKSIIDLTPRSEERRVGKECRE